MSWEDFFSKIPFTFFRTSLIQKKYIETIYDNTPMFGNLLEIAGGSGYTSAVVADFVRTKKANVTYSDLLSTLKDKSVNNFNSISNLSFITADSGKLPFKNDEFDLVFSQGFFEHFNDDEIVKFLKEQARVSKKIIFDVPNNKRWKKIQEYGNERFLSNKKWQELILKANLKVCKITGRRFTNFWKKLIPEFIRETEWFHRNFGESVIFVCEKNA